MLGLAAGGRMGVSVEEGKLVAEPASKSRPQFTLEELLAQCDPGAPLSSEDEAWLNDRPRGSELI
jgi:antitoxin ChpS